MADVLLVHVREDETLADNIGISLERSGLTVARGESVFDVGDEVPCVVVLWSDVSTRSSMVRDVAIRAQREGKLVAATLGGCETPLGFSRPAPHDLSEWGGDPDDPILDPVFFAADRLVCAAKLGGPKPQRPTQPYAQRPAAQDIRAERQSREVRYDSLPETPLPRARAYEPEPIEEVAPAPRAPVAPSAAAPAERDMPPNLAAETLAWKQIENSKNPQDFLDYLGHYGPKGLFSELASMKLDKLTSKSPAAAKGAFIAHKASPHADNKAKAKAPPPKRDERPAARPEPRAEARPAARPAPRPEPAQPTRADRPMSRLTEIERQQADAPPRTRVSAAARRRPPQAAAATRRPIHEESRRAAPWGALAVVVVLAGGGFAAFQNLPKGEPKAESPPGFAEAMRAAPVDEPFTPADAEEEGPIEATSFADASSVAPGAVKREVAKKPVRVAEAPTPREGIGGPIVTVAPKDTGGGAKTPPPVVTFRPVESTPAPATTPPPTPAPAVAPPIDTIDPTPAAPQVRYVQARWIKQPGGTALARYFPQAALDAGHTGTAVLDCAILQSGKLNCVVQSETPRGEGFGAAALAASNGYLASPQAADGSMAYGHRTRLTLHFK